MKKKLVFVMIALLSLMAGTVLTACSSSDNDGEIPDIPTEPTVPTDSVIPVEQPFVGVTYMEDSVRIQLQLLNSDSVATDTFKEGEDIIFKLTVTSTGREWVTMTPLHQIGDNIFNIYSSDGTDMGKPWDERLTKSINTILTPGLVIELVCSLLEEPDEEMKEICSWLEDPAGHVKEIEGYDWEEYIQKTMGKRLVGFLKKESRSPLPKGNYYTQFDVSIIEGRTTTIKMDFKVE